MVSFCLDVFFLGRGKNNALLQTKYRTSLDGQVHGMVFFVGRKFSQMRWSALLQTKNHTASDEQAHFMISFVGRKKFQECATKSFGGDFFKDRSALHFSFSFSLTEF